MGWTIVVAVVAGVLLGACLGWWAARRLSAAQTDARSASDLADARARLESMAAERERDDQQWSARLDQLQDQLDQARAVREAESRERAQAASLDQQRQGRVLEALAPVRDHLVAMQHSISDMEKQRQLQYGALDEQMRHARESDAQLRATTSALESALRNTSVRGAWGEAQLRNIVESAGLVEHVDFDVQASVSTEDGRRRPDMVLHLPGGKTLPIDAKVPFDSYIRAMEIPAQADGPDGRRRAEFMAEHVKALRAHVDALAKREYWDALPDSPDFVVAFVPSESLLSAALEADPALLDHAFSKRVALASPVTLWSVMKTVAYAWQQDVLTAEAKELFDLSRELYHRLGTLASRADTLRGSLEKSVAAWNSFAGTLEGRVLVTARRLQRLDESSVIPETRVIESAPRLLAARELAAPEEPTPAAPSSDHIRAGQP